MRRQILDFLYLVVVICGMCAVILETVIWQAKGNVTPSKPMVDAEREFMRPTWLNDNFQRYYDNTKIYMNEEVNEDTGACYINRWGEIYINWDLDERWRALRLGKWCMAHETGHWVDRQTGYPSGTEEFQHAIDLAADMDWQIANFSCISGKSCADGEWGGYGEIYAEMFERERIEDIPAILWDWYLPYYLMEGE